MKLRLFSFLCAVPQPLNNRLLYVNPNPLPPFEGSTAGTTAGGNRRAVLLRT
jgi:hypothetical protein